MRGGKEWADRLVDDITTRYVLDTYPGSSGCAVVSYIVENTDKGVLHEVPHSKGKGVSGAGVTKTLKKIWLL